MPKISFITIGTELLKGRIVNTNVAEAGLLLRRHGYELHRNLSIPDTEEAIRNAITDELAKSDVVLMSGGLGPTRDDITKKVLLDLYASKLVPDQPTLDRLTAYYQKRGRVFTETNQQQAYVPDTCTVVPNFNGTAPGMWFNFPTAKPPKMLFSMPGVPFEMLAMLENGIVPHLKDAFNTHYFHHRILRLTGIAESDAADRLTACEDKWPPDLDVAYLPRRDGLWIELSITGPSVDSKKGSTILEDAFKEMQHLMIDVAYTDGETSVPELLGNLLKDKHSTISVAESLTGGMVAGNIVSVSGSSAYFKGSVTAYDPAIKVSVLGVSASLIETHTVVSEKVAIAMADGVRKLMKSDIAISTTGIAEKDAETGALPHAWIGFSSEKKSIAMKVILYGNRNIARERAGYHALLLAMRELRS